VRALGREGAPQPGGVMKFTFARTDIRVTVDGQEVWPALAPSSPATS
jgi:hypothetical protein